VPLAEKAIMQAFEEALVGTIVMTKLEEVLEAHRAAQAAPAPLQAEAKQLRAQIARLVASLARGEIQEVHAAIAERKTRLAQVEDQLAATAAVQGVDIEEVAADWRAHLRSNKAAAQQVIRKILPEKLRVTSRPSPGVEWEFDGLTDYRKVLEEVGYQAVTAAVLQGLKLPRTPCPSPCSARWGARGTPRPPPSPRR
jgi:Glu-tRNA(Gln) amidotransferase subunit E-like FAD-binding protein